MDGDGWKGGEGVCSYNMGWDGVKVKGGNRALMFDASLYDNN